MAVPLPYRTARAVDPQPQWLWRGRLPLLLAMFVLPLIGVWIYVGATWPVVFFRLMSDGGVALMWLGGATGLGIFILRGLKMDNAESPGCLRWTTAAALGLGLLSLATLGLGMLGWLNSIIAWSLLAAGWIFGAVSLVKVSRSADHSVLRSWLMHPAGFAWLWLLATPFMALALTAAMAPPLLLWTPHEPHGYDVVEYHLQVPREWYEAHRIIPLPHNIFSYFPFNVEMHYLLAMHLRGGPWAGMYLAQLMHLAFFALLVSAVYGFARKRANPPAATIAALSLLTVPWLTQLSAIAYDEGGFLLFGTLSIGWALSAAFEPTHRSKRFAMAGVMAGFAAGSKLTAVPEVLIAVPVVLGIAGTGMMAIHHRRRAVFLAPSPLYSGERTGVRGNSGNDRNSPNRPSPQPSPLSTGEREKSGGSAGVLVGSASADAVMPSPSTACAEHDSRPVGSKFWFGLLIFALTGLLSFSPWLIRNIAWAHNPVFPEMMPLLGHGEFSPTQVERFEKAHTPPPAQQPFGQRLKAFGREVLGVWPAEKDGETSAWQFGYLILPLGLIAFALSLRRPEAWCLLGLLLILTLFWLLMTHLQSRFYILAAPIAALLIAGIDWRRGVIAGITLVAIFAAIGWMRTNSLLCDKLYGSGKNSPAIVSVLGMDGVSLYEQIMPADLPKNGTVILVGDARAFLYPIPMTRLRYRTVFDVKSGAPDIIQAWVGDQPVAPGDCLVIDPGELKRFHQTYFGLPPLPPKVERANAPYIVRH